MNTRLLAELEKVIREWSDSHCEEDDWPNLFWTDDTVSLMAKAAACVFDAQVSENKYINDNG